MTCRCGSDLTTWPHVDIVATPDPMPLPVWDVCPECGQAPGYGCREGSTVVEYLHESRRTVPTSEASRIARAHERWLPADD